MTEDADETLRMTSVSAIEREADKIARGAAESRVALLESALRCIGTEAAGGFHSAEGQTMLDALERIQDVVTKAGIEFERPNG